LERKGLDSRGKRGKVEIPQAQPRKLDFLPAGKQVPAAERNGPVFMQSFIKCQPRSAFFPVQLRGLEARGHKAKSPKRHRTPFQCLCLMLVASGPPASAFLGIFLLYNGRLMGRVFLE